MWEWLAEHRNYLSDPVRMEAFREAIGEIVRPGAVVLDLGAGTGILGRLAGQAGAARVYEVDQSEMLEVARSLHHANPQPENVAFIKGHSRGISLPEKVDVVVADQMGCFGFEAGILECFVDARERLLKPGGKLIPARLDFWVTPVECGELEQQVRFWNGEAAGVDLRPVSRWAVNSSYTVDLGLEHLLGEPTIGSTLDLMTAQISPFAIQAEIAVTRPGTLHGIGGWFAAHLSPSVVLTNSPLVARRIKRRNAFYPLERSVSVQPEDRVQIAFQVHAAELLVRWQVKVLRQRTELDRFTHSTWQGKLITQESLRRTKPDFVPGLSPHGQARLTILKLMNEGRTVSEIEAETFLRHPQLFRSNVEAAVFVADFILRYAP